MTGNERHIASTDLQRNFGQIIADAHNGDVIVVENHRRPEVVMMSVKEYQTLLSERDALKWAETLQWNRREMAGEPQ